MVLIKTHATRKEIEVIENKFYKKIINGGFISKKYNGIIKLKETPEVIHSRLRN